MMYGLPELGLQIIEQELVDVEEWKMRVVGGIYTSIRALPLLPYLAITMLLNLATSQATAAQFPSYKLSEIRPLPGHDSTQVYGINNIGNAAGTSSSVSGVLPSRGFLWKSGQTINLGAVETEGYNYSRAYAVNDHNEVVGESGRGDAFFWSNGQMQIIATNGNIKAVSINNDGLVVTSQGGVWDGSDITYSGIRYAKDINQLGVVSGHTTGPQVKAAYAPKSGELEIVENLSDETDQGFGIRFYAGNDNGQFVGHRSSNGMATAFVWDNGTIKDLGIDCMAWDINNSGTIVGDCGSDNGTRNAVIWNSDLQSSNLNDLADSGDARLGVAYGINESGQIAVQGSHDGGGRGFILTPVPLPAAAWLFGSALIGLGVMKRKNEMRGSARVAPLLL